MTAHQTTNPIVALSHAMAQQLLLTPGDVATRMALADLVEEHDGALKSSAHAAANLRRDGSWNLIWVQEWGMWLLQWTPKANRTTHERFRAVSVYRVRKGLLPRCVECGDRAHYACGEPWRWVCDKLNCNVAVYGG